MPDFAGGDGSSSDPYQIESWEQFDAIRDEPSAAYELIDNIGPRSSGFDTIADPFTPIDSFSGVLDGNGNVLDGFVIDDDGDDVALIRNFSGEIRDVFIAGEVTKQDDLGAAALIAARGSGEFEDVGFAGEVTKEDAGSLVFSESAIETDADRGFSSLESDEGGKVASLENGTGGAVGISTGFTRYGSYGLEFGNESDDDEDRVDIGEVDEDYQQYTYSAWIEPYEMSGSGDFDQYGFTVVGTSDDYALWLLIREGEVRLFPFTSSTSGFVETDGAGIETNSRFHLVAQAEVDGPCRIYVDGELVLEDESGPADSWEELTLGVLRPDRGIGFNGVIDDSRLYNRVINESEIQSLYQGEHIAEGLVSWLPFGEGEGTTTADCTGINNNGELQNGVEWVDSIAALETESHSVELDGESGYISTSARPSEWDEVLTYSIWIEQFDTDTGNSFGAGTTSNALIIRNRDDSRIQYFPQSNDAFAWDVELPINQPYHLALWHDESTEEAELFINGESQGVITDGSSDGHSSREIWFGTRAGDDDMLNGRLDDARVYNRELSESEIQSLYHGSHITEGLVAWWPLNEGTGDIAYDRTHNGNNGELNDEGVVWESPIATYRENAVQMDRTFGSVDVAVGRADSLTAAGGLAGRFRGQATESYATPSIDDTENGAVGGLYGVSVGRSTDVYWNTESADNAAGSGGATTATGALDEELRGSSAPDSFDAFDFDSTWEEVSESDTDTVDNWYPILQAHDRSFVLQAVNIYNVPPVSLSVGTVSTDSSSIESSPESVSESVSVTSSNTSTFNQTVATDEITTTVDTADVTVTTPDVAQLRGDLDVTVGLTRSVAETTTSAITETTDVTAAPVSVAVRTVSTFANETSVTETVFGASLLDVSTQTPGLLGASGENAPVGLSVDVVGTETFPAVVVSDGEFGLSPSVVNTETYLTDAVLDETAQSLTLNGADVVSHPVSNDAPRKALVSLEDVVTVTELLAKSVAGVADVRASISTALATTAGLPFANARRASVKMLLSSSSVTTPAIATGDVNRVIEGSLTESVVVSELPVVRVDRLSYEDFVDELSFQTKTPYIEHQSRPSRGDDSRARQPVPTPQSVQSNKDVEYTDSDEFWERYEEMRQTTKSAYTSGDD